MLLEMAVALTKNTNALLSVCVIQAFTNASFRLEVPINKKCGPMDGCRAPWTPNWLTVGMLLEMHGSGVRGFVVLGCLWNEGQVIRVSNDIDRDQQAQRCGLSKVPQAAGTSRFAPANN